MADPTQIARQYAQQARQEFAKIDKGQFDIEGHTHNLSEIAKNIKAVLPSLKAYKEKTINKINADKAAEDLTKKVKKKLKEIKAKDLPEEEHDLEAIKKDIEDVYSVLEDLLKLIQKEIALHQIIEKVQNDASIQRGKKAAVISEIKESLKHEHKVEQNDVNKIARLTDKLLRDLLDEKTKNQKLKIDLDELVELDEQIKGIKVHIDVTSRVLLAEIEEIKNIAIHLHRVARALHDEWGISDNVLDKLVHVNKDKLF